MVTKEEWKEWDRKWHKENRARRLKENPEATREQERKDVAKHRKKVKDIFFDLYGRVCNCCGETEQYFLTIDHVNGGGTKERREGRRSLDIYKDAIINKEEGKYQVLCYNCNSGRARNGGVCPHKMRPKTTHLTII